jgi:hypothetical protein
MKGWNSIFLIFKSTMAFVYLLLGILILFYDTFPVPLSITGKITIGIVFIMYGLYRIYSNYLVFKAKRNED